MKNKEMDNIIKVAAELNKLYNQEYLRLKKEVTNIIKTKSKEEKHIEKILDQLINIPTDKSYQLLIKLCNYVQTFNQELANDYLEIFKELYLDDENNKEKNKKKELH